MIFFLLPQSAFPIYHVYGEYRERLERHINKEFSGKADDNRSDLYTRIRLGMDAQFSSLYSAKIEYQNAADTYWTHKKNAGLDWSDMGVGYVKYSSQALTITGGRQRIQLDQGRLIGVPEWTNNSRSLDVGRVQSGQWDAFAGRLGVALVKPEPARFAVIDHADPTWGITTGIYKHDIAANGAVEEGTLDQSITKKFGTLTLDGEAAIQAGHNNGLNQQAWMYHARATQQLFKKTNLLLETDAASGGKNSDTSHTFDNLYPANHNLYGLSDMQALMNVTYYSIAVQNRSIRDLTLTAREQTFALRDASDDWYNSNGSPNARVGGSFVDPTGKSGTNVGSEFDLEGVFNTSYNQTIQAGLGLFTPGTFIQKVAHADDKQVFAYMSYQIKF